MIDTHAGTCLQVLRLSGADFCLSWQHREIAIGFDKLAVCDTDRPDAALEIIQANWIHVVSLDPQRVLPVDLICQGEPREAHHRHARTPERRDVIPLAGQPVDSMVADPVRLAMEQWN